MTQAPPVVVTIAGFDPSSGAGTLADIKTLAAHGCYGVGCITALTVQSTAGVKRVEPVSAKLVRETLEELAADLPIAAARIGMLGSAAVVEAVADFLATGRIAHVVLDPILKSSSGADLIEQKGAELMVKLLFSRVTVITPNIDEAARLTGLPVSNVAEMKAAARKLHEMGAKNVIVTGGHLDRPIDLLSVAEAGGCEQAEFASERLRSTATHGTGCAFSTAVAANLALGKQLRDAVVLAKAYVTKAIARAYPLGRGAGPIHHLFRMEEQPRPAQDAIEPKH
ncbi:MAG: bifunctional hydroxymethylpyrimidine kinase/phosphomethylpyrimidine kinase [Terriglobales bacterium]